MGILPPIKVDVEIRAEDKDMVERAMAVYEQLARFAL